MDELSAEGNVKTRIGIALAATAALASSSLFAAGRTQGVNVLRSSEQSIQIEFTPEYSTPRAIKFNSQEFVEYDFLGSAKLARQREAGAPDINFKRLTLGFQSQQGNAVQVIAADYEDIPNVLLKPMPLLHVKDEMVVVKDYPFDTQKYNVRGFLPEQVADLSPVEQVRSMLIGNVNLYPLQYNPATKTLRKYSRIVVEVSFGASSAPRITNNDDVLFSGALLNFNEAKSWKFGKAARLGKVTGQPSVLASGTWYRMTVSDEGMYRLDANWFSANNISLAGVDPKTIKIYGNGGEELPENVLTDRPVDLVENTIYVEGESDGTFNASDFVLFYGRGVQGARYDATSRTLRHYIHHYSRVNYYWLTFGGANGKRMEVQQSLTSNPTVIPSSFKDIAWVEPDTVNIWKSGKDWLSFPISPNSSQVRSLLLQGVQANEPRLYRYRLVSLTGSSFTVAESGDTIGRHYVGGSDGFEVTGAFPLTNGTTSQLSFKYSSGDASALGFFDWAEVIYPRRFEPVNNYLRFRSPDTNGIVEYRLGQFSGTPSYFDVTDHDSVKRITGVTNSLKREERAGVVKEYLALSNGSYKQPNGVARIEPQNLQGIGASTPYDFIIITSPEFAAAANRLKAHRAIPDYGGFRTIVVDINQIYNEFSGGVPDVTAVRDFLKYAYENWNLASPPKYVLFFGQASVDYKGIYGKSSYVPTWQNYDSYNEVNSASTDDYFVRFSQSSRPLMVTGRLNPRSPREADIHVDKLIRYDTESVPDAWKMRIVYVADDSLGDPAFGSEGIDHINGSENLASLYTPEVFDKRKIYLDVFPTVQASQGRRKPEAYQAIIDEINQGALIVNYVGHGNPTVWAHENVFSVATSIPQLTNANKLSVFFGATCNFSQFDDYSRATGSEVLINKPDGGAIAVVAATRKVYSVQNHRFNYGVYTNMFRTEGSDRVRVARVAEGIFGYKQSNNDDNDEKYFLLGDPTMRLQFPRRSVAIDSMNGIALQQSNAVQLRSLSRVSVKGSILDEAGGVSPNASGRVVLSINDGTRNVLIPSLNFTYRVNGSLIYRGQNSVSHGKFAATFVVPKDIAYADSTTRGRLVAQFFSDTTDGAGYTSKIWIGGTDPSAQYDSVGPAVKILLGSSYENSLSFRPGDVVNEKPSLFVDLIDSSGINTSTSGVGHRIEAWINNSAQSIDLTDYYTSKLDSYQAGTVSYPLRGLAQGRNSVKVRAWDTHNNANTNETFFEVMSSEQLSIVDVTNFPNPFSKTTAFTFKHNQNIPVNSTVKVYTVGGRLIRTIENQSTSDSFVAIPWDGRDNDGDQLANGVYLYKLLVRTVDGRFSSEVLGKLAIAK